VDGDLAKVALRADRRQENGLDRLVRTGDATNNVLRDADDRDAATRCDVGEKRR
jgi:hypothetical protein